MTSSSQWVYYWPLPTLSQGRESCIPVLQSQILQCRDKYYGQANAAHSSSVCGLHRSTSHAASPPRVPRANRAPRPHIGDLAISAECPFVKGHSSGHLSERHDFLLFERKRIHC
jgi:hypothetical protein